MSNVVPLPAARRRTGRDAAHVDVAGPGPGCADSEPPSGGGKPHQEPAQRDGRPTQRQCLSLHSVDRALGLADPATVFLSGLVVSLGPLTPARDPVALVIVLLAATLLFARALGRGRRPRTGAHRIDLSLVRRMGGALILTFAVIATALFSLDLAGPADRRFVFAWFATAAAGLATLRLSTAFAVRRALRAGKLTMRVAIYGGDAQGVAAIEHLTAEPDPYHTLIGYFDERFDRVPSEIAGLRRRGGLDELEMAVANGEVNELIIALPLAAADRLTAILRRMSRYPVTVLLAPDLAMWRHVGRPFEPVAGAPMLRALDAPMTGWSGLAKLVEDRCLGALLALLAAPVLLVCAVAIKLDSPGPVFFRQPRRGWNGSVFRIYKLRTMYVSEADAAGEVQATRRDARVTRVGAVLRRTSLDELPQLLNVLAGHMSLVGPRPHALGTRAQGKPFKEAVADYMRRYKVKPGITGWAQVNGFRGETETAQKLLLRVRYDIDYIENWSLWFDLWILAVTPFSLLLRSRTAY